MNISNDYRVLEDGVEFLSTTDILRMFDGFIGEGMLHHGGGRGWLLSSIYLIPRKEGRWSSYDRNLFLYITKGGRGWILSSIYLIPCGEGRWSSCPAFLILCLKATQISRSSTSDNLDLKLAALRGNSTEFLLKGGRKGSDAEELQALSRSSSPIIKKGVVNLVKIASLSPSPYFPRLDGRIIQNLSKDWNGGEEVRRVQERFRDHLDS